MLSRITLTSVAIGAEYQGMFGNHTKYLYSDNPEFSVIQHCLSNKQAGLTEAYCKSNNEIV